MKQTITVVGGLALMFAGAVGHFCHKYFTIADISRSADFHKYVSEHWHFWVAFLIGVLLLWLGARGHPKKRSSEPSSRLQ